MLKQRIKMCYKSFGGLITFMMLAHFVFAHSAYSQVFMPTGSISGQVKDSIDLTILRESTIAIYSVSDSTLIKYQLNDSKGRFKISNLPLDSNLMLVVSYIGFRPFRKNFKLSADNSEIQLQTILLSQSSLGLKEVVIRQPPMVMRGDTLEFNADAFKSRKNAVIGDLMKDLPGFTIWGDGLITVNGKKVSQVLVEGKIFFTGDSRISMNNIPKESVNKIQVIPDRISEEQVVGDTAVKTYTVNIGLKSGSKSGMFGKVGYGRGFNGRLEAQGVLSRFTPKTQLSLAGDLNNINKENSTINNILAGSGYRSEATTRSYDESNFSLPGINNHRFAGGFYERIWKQSLKSRSEFNLNRDNDYLTENLQETTLLLDSSVNRQTYNESRRKPVRYALYNNIEFKDSTFNILNVNTKVYKSNNTFASLDSTLLTSSSGRILNRFNGIERSNSVDEGLELGINYIHNGKGGRNDFNSVENFELNYNLQRNSINSARVIQNNSSIVSADINSFDRQYQQKNSNYYHRFNAEYKNLARLIGAFSSLTDIRLAVDLDYKRSSLDQDVYDKDLLANSYSDVNTYLTHRNFTGLLTFMPKLLFSQTFFKYRPGGNVRSIYISVNSQAQYISQKNTSTKVFRNISNNYFQLVPNGSIAYSLRNTGKREHRITLGITTASIVPTIEQLAPLVDSIQRYQYFIGNIYLKSSYSREVTLNYDWSQEKTNGVRFNLSYKYGLVANNISDSISYNATGVRILMPVNVDGRSYSIANAILSKAFRLDHSLVTWKLSGQLGRDRNPLFINSVLEKPIIRSASAETEIGLSLKSVFGLQAAGWYRSYATSLLEQGSFYRIADYGSRFQISVAWPQQFLFGSSINLNFYRSRDLKNVSPVIWNSFLSYRFLDSEQFEVKISVNDMLNQNVGIRNFSANNILGRITTNRLTRYGMFSLAYYPRIFKSAKK